MAIPRFSQKCLTLASLCAGLITSHAVHATDFEPVWAVGASDWASADQPPAGWQYAGDNALTLTEQFGAAMLALPNAVGALTELTIPYPFPGRYEEVSIEIRLGAESTPGGGLNWFLKKGGWELRADNTDIFLHNPDTKERVMVGAFKADTIQSVVIVYDTKAQVITSIQVDGQEATGATPYLAPSLGTGGSLTQYATTNTKSEVWFESLSLGADSTMLANLPRWQKPETAETDPETPPWLLTWTPVPDAEVIEFKLDPERLANPAFERDVFFSREDFGRLPEQLQNNPAMQEYWSGLERVARSYLKAGAVDLPEDETARTTYKSRFTAPMALLYAATGEPHLGQMIREVVIDLVERPMHFWVHSDLRKYDPAWPVGQLETAELARSVALTVHWARDLFSEEEYEYIMSMLQEKGLDPSLRWIDERADLQKNNYLAVIGGGVLITAIVQEDKEAEERALYALDRWLDLVEPDGSYGEPQGYFEYGCSRFFFAWWALGPERGKELLQGHALKGSLDWMVYYFILAEHESVTSAWRINFGDDDFLTGPKGRTTFTRIVCESLAYAYDDGLGTWISENLIHPDARLNMFEFTFKLSSAGSHLPAPVSPEEKGLPLAQSFDNGIVMIRSNWDFADSTVFALRSGGAARTGYSHDYPNRNAFALMAHGDYLAIAPGRSSYRSPLRRSWDIPTTTQNTVTLDGETQTRNRHAEVTEFVDTVDYVKVSSEAKDAYSSEPDSVLRTVWYVKALDAFLIRDRVRPSQPQTPSWHILLSNFSDKSTLEPLASGGWKLQRPDANLAFWVEADQALEMSERDGYMHSGYSYFPGDPFEGPEGSAFSMTWATPEPVESVHFYSLLFPNAGTVVPSIQRLSEQTAWDVELNGQTTRLSLSGDTLSIEAEAIPQ